MPKPFIKLGTKTRWGRVAAAGFKDGERWYMMIAKNSSITLMPDDMMGEYYENATTKKNS